MGGFKSCISECAICVCEETNTSSISPDFEPPTLNTTKCLYKTTLSTQNQILITLTWTKNPQTLAINFNKDPSTHIQIRRPKGTKSIDLHPYKIKAVWDLSAARYQPGPEPVSGFYIIITFDSEPGLVLGDNNIPPESLATFSLLSREVHISGNALYATRARFCESGNLHDVLIRCGAGNEGGVLSVSLDRKVVMRVERLKWNFRGNQAVFVDGLVVDLMWDVHGWLYDGGPAVFMFRIRNGNDSRLWLEEKDDGDEDNGDEDGDDDLEFSFTIYATHDL